VFVPSEMDGQESYDVFIKMILIGDSSVGKSCLIERYTENTFAKSHLATIGIDFKIKMIELDGKRVKLQILDTAGQERFKTITTTYYKGVQGAILVYDISDERTFKNVQEWITNVRANATKGTCILLVGNKCDLTDQRLVETSQGETVAKELGVPFLEASAKNGTNVEQIFIDLTRNILGKCGDKNTVKKKNSQNQKCDIF